MKLFPNFTRHHLITHTNRINASAIEVLRFAHIFLELFYKSNGALLSMFTGPHLNTWEFGEFAKVIQTLDYVTGLHNCLECAPFS